MGCALVAKLVLTAGGSHGEKAEWEEGSGLTLLPWDKPCLKGSPRAALGQDLPSTLRCHAARRSTQRGAVPGGDRKNW